MLLYLPLSSHSPSAHPAIAFFFYSAISASFLSPLFPVILCLAVSDLVLDSLSYIHTHTHTQNHCSRRCLKSLKIVWISVWCFLRSGDVWNFDFREGWNGWNWSRSWNSTFRQYCSWLAVFYSHHALWLTLFSSLLFSSLHLRLLFVLVVVWCRAVLACCPRPDQNTHTHTHTLLHTIQNKDTHTHTHTHRACSVSSNITSDTFGLLVVFPRHGYEHAAFLCVGGLFKKKKKERTVMSQRNHSNSYSTCWVRSFNHLVNHYS